MSIYEIVVIGSDKYDSVAFYTSLELAVDAVRSFKNDFTELERYCNAQINNDPDDSTLIEIWKHEADSIKGRNDAAVYSFTATYDEEDGVERWILVEEAKQ